MKGYIGVVNTEICLECKFCRETDVHYCSNLWRSANTEQIQIDTNESGKGIFDAVESLNLDIDIVPIFLSENMFSEIWRELNWIQM